MKRLRPFIWAGITLFSLGGFLTELISQGVWKTYTTDDGLLPSTISDITQDRQGNYWVATRNGVCWMDHNETWHPLIDSTRFDSTLYFKNSILIDHQNNKWLVAQGLHPTKEYIVCYNDTTFTYFDLSSIYTCFGFDANQHIWVGTIEQLVYMYDRIQWYPYYVTSPYHAVTDFQLDKNGRLYVAHETGIGLLTPLIQSQPYESRSEIAPEKRVATFRDYLLEDVRCSGMPVFDLALDQQNNLLGATWSGVMILKNDRQSLQFLTTNDGLLCDMLDFIAVDSSNQIWVDYHESGFIGKVSCFNGITWQHFEFEGPFPFWRLGRIYVGRDGSVWIGTYQQIYIYQDTTTTKVRNRTAKEFPIQKQFDLAPVYPNPCKNQTQIRYDLNTSQTISLAIYNILGKEVIQLENGKKNIGTYITRWNGTDKNGNPVGNGIYLLVLKGNSLVQIQTICVIK